MALILREKHVRSLLSMRDTITVLEEAFNALAQSIQSGRNDVVQHPRTRIAIPKGVLTFLAGAAAPFGVMGFKTYTASREGIRYLIMLFSSQNGQLLSILEAERIGSMRTGGTSAVATKYLAREDATIVGLIGAGAQAVTQLMGVCTVRPITIVYVYSRRARERELFCQEMQRLLNVQVIPVNHPRQAIEPADIVITATTASEPVLHGEWLKPGCHVNAIGSNWAHRRELDFTTLQRSSIISTDSVEQAQIEAGDFLIPINEGLLDWQRIHDLFRIIHYRRPQRTSPTDITIYKGLGTALEDIATAAHVYNLARRQGLGEEISLLI
jgi:alanine dehydrogenase